MIPERRSTEMHLNTAYRHMRLCSQVKGAESLIPPIEKAIADLKDAYAETEQARINKEAANDLVNMYDAVLDDEVRNLFDEVKKYDRNNPTGKIMKMIFPEERYGDIVKAPLYSEPDEANKLITRIDSLGDHPLKQETGALSQAIAQSRESIATLKDLITQWKMVEAEEEIAKGKLRLQYEHNYLDAIKMFDKRFAQRLFPNLTKASKIQIEISNED